MFDGFIYDKYYLSFGRIRFYQRKYNNFYNRIKFSIIKDGYHNIDYSFNSIHDETYKNLFHYDKNVTTNLLAGLNNSYTDLIIDVTTPHILYYWWRWFKIYFER